MRYYFMDIRLLKIKDGVICARAKQFLQPINFLFLEYWFFQNESDFGHLPLICVDLKQFPQEIVKIQILNSFQQEEKLRLLASE